MELLDSVGGKEAAHAPAGQESRVSIDRFEATRTFQEREEEEKVEAAMALYEKAARQRMPPGSPEPQEELDVEALEALSQELKLRQKCQDIAALILVDELEEELDEEEEPPKRRKREG